MGIKQEIYENCNNNNYKLNINNNNRNKNYNNNKKNKTAYSQHSETNSAQRDSCRYSQNKKLKRHPKAKTQQGRILNEHDI